MKCKRCKNGLEFIPNYTFEDIETNEEKTGDVWRCSCGALHYKENGCDVYEFSTMPTIWTYVAQKSDAEIIKSKIKEKEYAEEI